MKLLFGLAVVWTSVKLSRCQCVLEKEYFCSSIPNGFPEGLTSLLFVVTNLGVINSSIFNSPSLQSVTSLALANSGIRKIEPGAFHTFRSLTKLSLYQNSLTNVMASWLSNPGHLENLTVAQNLIAEIAPNTFSGFSNLTTLNLANNRIRRIASGSFKHLSKLAFMDLSGNNLTALTRDVFSGLVAPTVKLGGNPWNCSCELLDFALFLQELINASLLEDAASVVCSIPPNLEGFHVWNISDLTCPPGCPMSVFENGFHKVGLPALLACLAFVSFILSLFLIWLVKRDKQVQPDKDAPDPTTNAKPSSHVDSVAELGSFDDKEGTAETDILSNVMKIRAKSASAILLRTEFHQKPPQTICLTDANVEYLVPPSVSLNDQCYVGSKDLSSISQLWYYHNLEDCREMDLQSSFLSDVQVKTPATKASSEPRRQIPQGTGISEAPESVGVKSCGKAENPEPFLYLSVATEAEELADVEPQKAGITKTDESHLVSLKRALTWPYGRNATEQKSTVLSIRESFMTQFLLPKVNLGKHLHVEELENCEEQLYMHPGKEYRTCDDGPELNDEAKLAKETKPLYKRESKTDAGESMDVGKLEFAEERQRQQDPHLCPKKDDQRNDGRAGLNTEGEASNQPQLKFQQEPKVAGAAKHSHSSTSEVKAAKCPPGVKNKQAPNPASSLSGVCYDIRQSPPPSDSAGPKSSPSDDLLLENNQHNYTNLLYEVVENRGRWTRERWKQNRRIGVMNKPLAKS